MTARPKSLRERIRAVTDALKPGTALKLGEIRRRLRGAKPQSTTLGQALRTMVRKNEIVRDDAPDGAGSGALYVYRSGPSPVTDMRHERSGGQQKIRTGFCALARLEKENPKEWARLTGNGTL